MAKQAAIPPKYSENWLEKMDGRTTLARAVNDRFHALTQDLGGSDRLSYQRLSLCKRIVHLECLIEQQEIALSRGEEVDQGRLTQAVNTLIGLLKTVGLDRMAHDIPDLATFLKNREAAK